MSAIASGRPKRISKRKVDDCQERILKYAVADILKQTMEKSLIRQYTWNGYSRLGPKKTFKDSNAHKLLKRVLGMKGFADDAGDDDIGNAVRYAIRISGDWNGGRTDRRNEKKVKNRRKNKNPAPTQVENEVSSQSSDHQVPCEAEVSSQEISSKENRTESTTPVSATDATPGNAIIMSEEAEIPSQETSSEVNSATSITPVSATESLSEDEDESDLIQSSNDEITNGATQAISRLEEAFPLQSSDDQTTHGKIDVLVADGNFQEAISLLESHPTTELQQMKLIICYSQIEDFEKTLEIIENMKTLMARTRHFTADDLCRLAKWRYDVESISLYACASKLFLLEADPNDRVRGIKKCILGCSWSKIFLRENRRIFDKVGVKIMKDFINDVTSVENADPDVKTESLASCLCNTGWCYYELASDLDCTGELDVKLKMYDEAKGYYERGLDVMRKHFGSDSSKHKVFGELLHRMANVSRGLGEYFEARIFYLEAIEAYESAEGWLWQSFVYEVEVSLSEIEVEAVLQGLDDWIMHGKYDALVKVGKFREAITLLDSHPKTELQQFRLLECYSREEEIEKSLEIIQNMKTLMTETRRFTADDLCQLAEKILARLDDDKKMDFEENAHKNVLRISFYVCASKLYLFEADPDDRVRGIKKCFWECYDKFPYLRRWTAPIGLKVINEFIDDMTSVEDANLDEKTKMLVWCLSHAGRYHFECAKWGLFGMSDGLELYDDGGRYCERGIEVMRRHFGTDSSKHKVFGELLHRTGDVNRYLGKYSEARTFYLQAIESYESAEDVDEGWDRQRSIDKVKESFSKIEIEAFLLQSSDEWITHGKSNLLVKGLKIREAITLLESHPKTELQQMKLYECYSRIGDFEKPLEIIGNIKTLMAQTRFAADDLCKLAEKKNSERATSYDRHRIRLKCIFLYVCASKLYLSEADPNGRVRGIKRCSGGGSAVITRLGSLEKHVAYEVLVKIMKEFIDDVTSVENADPDVKTEMLAWCLCNTGRCCVELGTYDEGKEYCERGVDVMRKRFGSDASKFEVFSELSHNMGILNR